MLKHSFIGSILMLFCLVSVGQRSATRYSEWGYGITGSPNYFLTTLIDASRFHIDSNTAIGFNDADYFEARKSADKAFVGFTAGAFVQYRLKPRLEFETGLQLVKAGTKVDGVSIGNQDIMQALGSNIEGKTVTNSYNILEVPVLLRNRIGRKPKFDLSTGRRSMITKKRYFFYSYGLGLGIPLNNRDLYNGVELTDVQANLGIAALLGLGMHQDFGPYFFVNARLHARATLLSYYEYAPIKTYFNAVGAKVNIGFRLPYKEKKKKEEAKSVKCATFQSTPVPDGRNKFVMGLRYGLNINTLMGGDAQNSNIAFKGRVESFTTEIESAAGDVSPTLAPHVGLHIEYLFHPRFSLTAIPGYAQRGYIADYTYFLVTGESLRSRQRVYLDYAEMPLRINYYPTNRLWIHLGATVSFNLSNRVYNYYQHFAPNTSLNTVNETYKKRENIKDLFGYSPDRFILGYEAGFGYHVDENFSVSLQGTYFEPIFVQDSGRENFFHFVPQISFYYFFLTK